MRRWHNRSWGWMALTLGLTPAFFFLEHWGPEGLPTAEGCSGAGAVHRSVWVRRDSLATHYSVATDGFFVLEARGITPPDSPDLHLMDARVSVTTLEGEVVVGRVFSVEGKQQRYWAWQADAPLEVGTKLRVAVDADPVAGTPVEGDQVVLEVTGAPASLEAGALGFVRWLDYRRGFGDKVSCMEKAPCGPLPSVFTQEQALVAAGLSWHAERELHGFTLWEVDVAAKEPAPDIPSPAAVLKVQPRGEVWFGALVFAENATSYCVTVSVKDLRSGAVKSTERCAEPSPLPERTVSRDYDLERCAAPPSEALTRAWCELKQSTLPECLASEPTPGEPKPQPTSNAADDESRTSSSCQVALVGASAAGGAVTGFGTVAALLTLLRRRRERGGAGAKARVATTDYES